MDAEPRWRVGWVGATCLVGVIAQAGCISLGRAQPPMRHYVLGNGTPDDATPSARVDDVTVGLRRAQLASYLAVPFLAVRAGPNEIEFSEFHRWGEPLGEGINRVVAGFLSSRGLRDVAVAPWPAGARYDYVIQIDVARFEGVVVPGRGPGEGEVHVSASWQIIRHADDVVVVRGMTDRTALGWTVGDYPGLVASFEEELDALALDLITGIAGLHAREPGQADVCAWGPVSAGQPQGRSPRTCRRATFTPHRPIAGP